MRIQAGISQNYQAANGNIVSKLKLSFFINISHFQVFLGVLKIIIQALILPLQS